jgi:hypothetical protein
MNADTEASDACPITQHDQLIAVQWLPYLLLIGPEHW